MVSPAETKEKQEKISLENLRVPTDFELDEVGKTLADFYKWRDMRSGPITQFQKNDFETVLKKSRELFWNAASTPSDDLRELGLEFSLPYVRKEVLQFAGKLAGQDYRGRFKGDSLDIFGVKVLQGIYNNWQFKNNDKVEKFWEILYGVVNGTVCNFIGYNSGKQSHRYLRGYNKDSGIYNIEEKEDPYWNDVWSEIVPIEDMYIPKIWERNFQKQGRTIWKTEMDWIDFKREFREYDNAEYVYPGNMIAEDSLYYRMLQGTGVTAGNKVQLLKKYVWAGETDKLVITANGVLLNPVGKGKKQTSSPLPFNHKMGPFSWGIFSPLDEKFAYGMPMPFLIKEPHKILNTANVMLLEHELRNVSPAILSSDFDAPKLIYGRHDVIPVNDVSAYKELKLSDPSNAFFQMIGTMKAEMTDNAQGGSQPMTPSKQPKSAKEVIELEKMKQASMGITLIMYYNILRQQMMLIIKTALQFYPIDKYAKEQRKILRAINVPNMSLSTGGVGNLEVRIVPKRGKDHDSHAKNLELFFEAINKGILNGKMTEIIEAPVDVIQNLEFTITDIDLEPAMTDEMKKATFMEQVITPMLTTYVPAGVADLGKVFLRHMEKLGEHPVDFSNEKVLSQIMSLWGRQNDFTMPPAPPKTGQGAQTGNVMQSTTGTQFGGQSNGGIPQ